MDNEKLAYFEKIQKANKEGYAGVLQNGNLVDRREHPMAMPIQENAMFGVAKPKQIIWERGILTDKVDNYDKFYVMSLEDEDGFEYEGIGHYSVGELINIEVHEKSEKPLPLELRKITLID